MTEDRLGKIERYWQSSSDHAKTIRELVAEVKRSWGQISQLKDLISHLDDEAFDRAVASAGHSAGVVK